DEPPSQPIISPSNASSSPSQVVSESMPASPTRPGQIAQENSQHQQENRVTIPPPASSTGTTWSSFSAKSLKMPAVEPPFVEATAGTSVGAPVEAASVEPLVKQTLEPAQQYTQPSAKPVSPPAQPSVERTDQPPITLSVKSSAKPLSASLT